MSGGIAYVYDPDAQFAALVNYEMVELVPLDDDDREWLRTTIARHRELTGSDVADRLLGQWGSEVGSFRKVMPEDYRRVLTVMREAESAGLSEEQTLAKVMESAHG
jgi:glutamate synthase (NADPH/NADH) large chain